MASDGIQGIDDPATAVRRASQANDALAARIALHPDRFAGFAAVAMQDASEAARETERCVRELGFLGVLVNGYSNGCPYYDDERDWGFWDALEALGVPLYRHPRNPLESQREIYRGRPELLGPRWAFGVETATHALRLIVSGLFDRFPKLTIILGHLGEGLPFQTYRLEQRLKRRADVSLKRLPTRSSATLRRHDKRQLVLLAAALASRQPISALTVCRTSNASPACLHRDERERARWSDPKYAETRSGDHPAGWASRAAPRRSAVHAQKIRASAANRPTRRWTPTRRATLPGATMSLGCRKPHTECASVCGFCAV